MVKSHFEGGKHEKTNRTYFCSIDANRRVLLTGCKTEDTGDDTKDLPQATEKATEEDKEEMPEEESMEPVTLSALCVTHALTKGCKRDSIPC